VTNERSSAKRVYPYTIHNGAGEWLTFERRVPGPQGERVVGTTRVSSGAGPPMHVHFQQDESFTVVSGRLGYQRAGQEPMYGEAGDSVLFKAGEAHRFWNAGDTDLHCTAYVEPPGNVEYLLAELFESQRRNGGRRPSVFDAAFLTRRYRTEYEMLVVPAFVQRFVFPLIVVTGTLLGRFTKYADAPAPLPAHPSARGR
jgi:quercetin dioxygenase-like cupin family protein